METSSPIQIWSVRIEVITADCLSAYRGSIPLQTAKFCAIGCNGVWLASTLNAQGFLAWVRILHGAPSFNVVEEIKMNIENMVGKVFTSVTEHGREMVFANDTEKFKFLHWQDCCESVYIESVVGDLSDLEGEPLLIAEEVSGEIPEPEEGEYIESRSWTFYKFATRKGYVDVRWLGESNGYYSESVDLEHELV